MFESLPKKFREYGLQADIRSLLLLQKSFNKNLIHTLGDIHNVLKCIIVKEPRQIGPFTQAFYDYFLNIVIHSGENLQDAIVRSASFKHWRDDYLLKNEVETLDNLVNLYLEEIHLSSYDIAEVIDGFDIWKNDKADLEDNRSQNDTAAARELTKLADYSKLSMAELMQRLHEVAQRQNSKHAGGSHWIGTGGISAYGHGGAAKNGIRIGGTGGGKMARAVLNDKNFYPVDLEKNITDNSIDAALAALKGIVEESTVEILDVENTITEGLKKGGLFLPELKNQSQKKLQVLLFIDNGGYSMLYYVKIIQQLFKKMKVRFAHDLETYYFHNTIYDVVYSDAERCKEVKIETILSKDPNYRIFIIGDASMAPYELTKQSIYTYNKLIKKFKKTVWINPERESDWAYTLSIQLIHQIIPMFAMTPKGIENAVISMNKASQV